MFCSMFILFVKQWIALDVTSAVNICILLAVVLISMALIDAQAVHTSVTDFCDVHAVTDTMLCTVPL